MNDLFVYKFPSSISEEIEQIKWVHNFILKVSDSNLPVAEINDGLSALINTNISEEELTLVVYSLLNQFLQENSLAKICEYYQLLKLLDRYKNLKESVESNLFMAVLRLIHIESNDPDVIANIIICLNKTKNEALNYIHEAAIRKFQALTQNAKKNTDLIREASEILYKKISDVTDCPSKEDRMAMHFVPLPVQKWEDLEDLNSSLYNRDYDADNSINVRVMRAKINGEIIEVAAKITTAKHENKLNKKEADTLYNLQFSKHVVKLYGIIQDICKDSKGKIRHRLIIVLEKADFNLKKLRDLFVGNVSEKERITAQDSLENEALVVLHQLSKAMVDARSIGIFHRDIKPDNILVFKNPGQKTFTYKFTDYGICREFDPNNLYTPAIEDDRINGTGYYAAPELMDKKDFADQLIDGKINYNRSDMFSLGNSILCVVLGYGTSNRYTPNLQTNIDNELALIKNEKLRSVLSEMLKVNINERILIRDLNYRMENDIPTEV